MLLPVFHLLSRVIEPTVKDVKVKKTSDEDAQTINVELHEAKQANEDYEYYPKKDKKLRMRIVV